MVPIHERDLGGSTLFDRYAAGEELFGDLDRESDLLDRDLRLFVEEADCMQGVQVFMGGEDGWGGFTGRYLERVRDEYGKVAVWVWAVESGGGGGGLGVGRVSWLSVVLFWFVCFPLGSRGERVREGVWHLLTGVVDVGKKDATPGEQGEDAHRVV